MAIELESAKRLNALKAKADAKTGETSDTLADAVDTLIAGFGQGGGGDELTPIKWLEVDADGYPIKADFRGIPTTDYICYSYTGTFPGNYRYMEEAYIDGDYLGYSAFRRCEVLKTIHGIENITVFNDEAADTCRSLMLSRLNANCTRINNYAFRNCEKLALTEIPATVQNIGMGAFGSAWKNSSAVKFRGTPQSIATTAFTNNNNIIDIYVPWAEGAVANAPWGATKATIHYNTTYDSDGNPVE